MFEWTQERNLLITDQKLYNFKKRSKTFASLPCTALKRAILLSKISGVTKSLFEGSKEFVIHVPSEYDYRFSSDR